MSETNPSADNPDSTPLPAASSPPADKPAADKNAADKSADDKHADDKHADDKPADDKHVGDKHVGDKNAADKNAADKSAADKPAVLAETDGTSSDEGVKVFVAGGGLTGGCVHRFYEDGKKNLPSVAQPWLLQVIDIRQIGGGDVKSGGGGGGGVARYRVMLSDGETYQQAMLSTDLNGMVSLGLIQKYSLVQLTEAFCNTVNQQKILIALKMNVTKLKHTKIGAPVSVDPNLKPPPTPKTPQPPTTKKPEAQVPTKAKAETKGVRRGLEGSAADHTAAPLKREKLDDDKKKASGDGDKKKASGDESVYAVSDLNTYMSNKWAIKARVVAKTPMKSWENSRGAGRFFSMDLLDAAGGQIRATAYKAEADKWYEVLDVGKVYIFRNGQLKDVDRSKPWNKSAKHECEIAFMNETNISEVVDDRSILKQRYDFVKVRDIQNSAKEDMIDIIGIVFNISPISEITSKKSGHAIPKRTLCVRDETNTSVEITLWGAPATDFTETALAAAASSPIVAFRGLKVTDFAGRSLSLGFDGGVEIMPDRPETNELKKWWETVADQKSVATSLTVKAGAGNENRVTVADMQEKHLGYGEKADYVTLRAMVLKIFYTPDQLPWYKACPNKIDNPSSASSSSMADVGVAGNVAGGRGRGRGGGGGGNRGGGWRGGGRGGQGGGDKKEYRSRRPQERECAKKVIVNEDSNSILCTSCGALTDYNNRYMMSFMVGDHTGTVRMTAFNDAAKEICGGRDANELAHMWDSNKAADVERIFQHEAVQYRLLKCRIKAEKHKHNGDMIQQIVVMETKPINFKDEAARLLEQINALSNTKYALPETKS